MAADVPRKERRGCVAGLEASMGSLRIVFLTMEYTYLGSTSSEEGFYEITKEHPSSLRRLALCTY